MSNWISVNDRLPADDDQIVLVCLDGISIDLGFCGRLGLGGRFWSTFNSGGGSVTHWMPLPEPPKELE